MEMAMAIIDESVLQTFSDDHEQLRETLERAIDACRSCALHDARASFYRFEDQLRRHVRTEDDVLFPAFEAHTGLRNTGPTAVMRREHREIERRLDRISDALDGKPDLTLIERELVALQALLADHDRREERVIYPACDRFFTQGERYAAVCALEVRS
jgi:iron-sulfur cluster repair protein YtfE (RIC family)